MIEAIDVCPGLHGMTSLTTKRCSIRPLFRHSIVEFALVRVLMAHGAGLIFKFERQDLIRPPGGPDFMTIAAGNRRVRAGKREF